MGDAYICKRLVVDGKLEEEGERAGPRMLHLWL